MTTKTALAQYTDLATAVAAARQALVDAYMLAQALPVTPDADDALAPLAEALGALDVAGVRVAGAVTRRSPLGPVARPATPAPRAPEVRGPQDIWPRRR